MFAVELVEHDVEEVKLDLRKAIIAQDTQMVRMQIDIADIEELDITTIPEGKAPWWGQTPLYLACQYCTDEEESVAMIEELLRLGRPHNWVNKEVELETWGPHVLRSKGWIAQAHMTFMYWWINMLHRIRALSSKKWFVRDNPEATAYTAEDIQRLGVSALSKRMVGYTAKIPGTKASKLHMRKVVLRFQDRAMALGILDAMPRLAKVQAATAKRPRSEQRLASKNDSFATPFVQEKSGRSRLTR